MSASLDMLMLLLLLLLLLRACGEYGRRYFFVGCCYLCIEVWR
jgi:hypothetical protein